MRPDKYRHICSQCGRVRSTSFHRKHPAGPGYPVVSGLCHRCYDMKKANNSHTIHHHHHWFHSNGDPALPHHDTLWTPDPQTTSSKAHPAVEPPPRYSELPAVAPPRFELSGIPRPNPQELPAEYIQYIPRETPPPVGPKPAVHRFSNLLEALLK